MDRELCVTPKLTILDLVCRTARSGKGPTRGGEGTHVVFVRRGAFGAHVGSRAYIADPQTALVSWVDTEYRISHPGESGDDCTVFDLAPELADELLAGLEPRADVELRLSPAMQVAHAALVAVIRRASGDGLVCEEAALELMAAVLSPSPRRRQRAVRPRRALVFAAIELLNEDVSANRSVSALAEQIGCSPWHLMRSFRAETGASLRGYRLQLRLAAALHRVAAGDRDLARIAADLGFASHAHLTGTFARLVGASPREIRARIARAGSSSGSRDWMGTFLKAGVDRRE